MVRFYIGIGQFKVNGVSWKASELAGEELGESFQNVKELLAFGMVEMIGHHFGHVNILVVGD